MPNSSTPRIVTCALAVGFLFAIATGMGVSGSATVSSSDGREAGLAKAVSDVQTVFSPTFALVGFLLGTPIGAAVGFLWSRSGVSSTLGLLLVTLLGGFAGLMTAGLLGAQTQVIVTDSSSSMEHGAPLGVLIGGAVLGLIGGAACSWWFRPSAGLEGTPAC